ERSKSSAPKRAGRKPLETTPSPSLQLDPKQKRKAQNRAAQRAFRERKEKHMAELQERIRELEELASKKDENLLRENESLKDQLRQLEQENYALKHSKFTFEFPLKDTRGSEHSPQSNGDDDSNSVNTPSNSAQVNDHLTSFDYLAPSSDFDFLAVSGSGDTTALPLTDLFHTKDDLFSSYRVPNQNDDFISQEAFSEIFGAEADLFGLSAPAPFSADLEPLQMPLPDYTTSKTENAQQSSHCPLERMGNVINDESSATTAADKFDFNLDALCEDMKKKATCQIFYEKYIKDKPEVEEFLSSKQNMEALLSRKQEVQALLSSKQNIEALLSSKQDMEALLTSFNA
ncbi:uncharacterized protein BYT42DRAFT_491537, partial [Radiomyces spectabilis]|uniref:uncharacterized protein n=1 Tax=Radiomyces spectabilis TaxID=64574 RepID=UPI00221E8633